MWHILNLCQTCTAYTQLLAHKLLLCGKDAHSHWANQSKQKSVAQFWAHGMKAEPSPLDRISRRVAAYTHSNEAKCLLHAIQRKINWSSTRVQLLNFSISCCYGARRQINSFHCLENVEQRIGTDVWTWTDALA